MSKRTRILSIILFLLALFLVNGLMALKILPRGIFWDSALRISPDFVVLCGFVWLTSWLPMAIARVVWILGAVSLLILRLFSLVEGILLALLRRRIILYSDMSIYSEVGVLMKETWGWSSYLYILYLIAALGFVLLLIWVLYWCLYLIWNPLRNSYVRTFSFIIWAVIALNIYKYPENENFVPWVATRVSDEIRVLLYYRQLESAKITEIDALAEKLDKKSKNMAKLADVDVYILIIESYAETIFHHPMHKETYIPALWQFEKDLLDINYSINSRWIESPCYGGASWLAHTTLDTGVEVRDQLAHRALLVNNKYSTAKIMAQAGHRPVEVLPGVTRYWNGSSLVGYKHHHFGYQMGYKGPRHGWSPMPDQYVLDYVLRKEVDKPDRQPLFMQIVLVTSHVPFNKLPPYIDDWSTLGDGSIFHKLPSKEYNTSWPYFGDDVHEAYPSFYVYELKVITEFLKRIKDRKNLVIIMGDHQPVPQISGYHRPWLVPMHIVTNSPELKKPFVDNHFANGVYPTPNAPDWHMKDFLPFFVSAYSNAEQTR